MLRTQGDFVLAANLSFDLSALVTTYINMFREYVNGYNGVRIPLEEYAITFSPPRKEGYISVQLHWIAQQIHTETLYYDTDSDYFCESLGADNSYGQSSHTEYYPESKTISIPIVHLMLDKAGLERSFSELKLDIAAKRAEDVRLREVEQLRARLKTLEGQK
ncbi:hypothetical protein D3C84_652890 [compost metagenome]